MSSPLMACNSVCQWCIVIKRGVAAASVVLFGHQSTEKMKNKRSVEEKETSKKENTYKYDPNIKEELTTRVRSFFGDEKFKILENKFVVVVGLGGVGSHAASMLVRSGIRRIRVIDFDQVTLSSLNRHAVANLGDVGVSKVEAVRRHFQSIVPWCQVEAIAEMFHAENAAELLQGNPDYVLDCIDDVKTKAELLSYCSLNNIKVLTSMGAGGKSDPTRLRIGTLADCVKDPLASKIRWSLKKHNVSPDSVLTVYSAEKPVAALLPLSDEQRGNPEEFGAVEHIRLRVLPVLGTSPAIFGQAMASYVLTTLADMPYSPEPGDRLSKNVKHRVRQKLNANEKRLYGSCEELDLDDEDLEFIIVQTWGTRCAVTGMRMGGGSLNLLVRWNPEIPPLPHNLVFVQPKYGEAIMASPTGGRGVDLFDSETKERIESRLKWCENMCATHWPPQRFISDFKDSNENVEASRQKNMPFCCGKNCAVSRTCLIKLASLIAAVGIVLYSKPCFLTKR